MIDLTSALSLYLDVLPVIRHDRESHPENVEEGLRLAYLNVVRKLFDFKDVVYFEGEKLDTFFADVCLYDEDYDRIEEYLHYNRYLIQNHLEYLRSIPNRPIVGLNIHSIDLIGAKLRIVYNYIYPN